jgi:shikimate dehydrogenase
MQEYGLIGRPLGHSFSQGYFTEKFASLGIAATYTHFELPSIEALPALLVEHPNLVGFNVTLPYKQEVLAYADTLSPDVAKASAANTLVRLADGHWEAHNTDIIGFGIALDTWVETLGRLLPTSAWILGMGGASRAVQVALQNRGIAFTVVGRKAGVDLTGKPTVLYSDLSELPPADLWVQTTPLGQFPHVHEALVLPYILAGPNLLAMDLVYNPAETHFMALCKQNGAQVLNGIPMLHAQAEAAWEIWQRLGGLM